jgi:YD repeat-containing protein
MKKIIAVIICFMSMSASSYAGVLDDWVSHKVDPMLIFRSLSGGFFWTAKQACLDSMPEPYVSSGNVTITYSEPEPAVVSNAGLGCYYQVDHSNGFSHRTFYQGWISVARACEKPWVLTDDNMCTKSKYGLSCPKEGNPIDPSVGVKVQMELDIGDVRGRGLQVIRRYVSRQLTNKEGMFGDGWYLAGFEKSLHVIQEGANSYILAIRSPNVTKLFSKDVDIWNSLVSTSDRIEEIENTTDRGEVWRYYDVSHHTVEYYDGNGVLNSITYPDGHVISLIYSDENTPVEIAPEGGLIIKIIDSSINKEVSFLYDAASRVSKVIDSNGQEFIYAYQERYSVARSKIVSLLASVSYPGGSLRRYHYERAKSPLPSIPDSPISSEYINSLADYNGFYPTAESEILHQSRPRVRMFDGFTDIPLTGITSEDGLRFATWEYDLSGRAILSEHADGSEQVVLTYNPDGTTTVTDAAGAQRTYHFTVQQGQMKVDHIEGDRCTTCSDGDIQAYTYDSNGFVASKTDWNGNTTTYTRDSQGRELTRSEASATPQVRTTTTTWDTTLNKPLTVTEPDRLTEYTYDTEGRLLNMRQSFLQ